MARVKFDRFMVDVHIGSNRKLRALTIPQRWCFLAGVLPVAAQAPIRGKLLIGTRPAGPRDYAEQSGVSPKVALAMLSACRELALIEPDEELNCDRVHDFDEWNPRPREDPTAADRARRYREKLRRHADITHRDDRNGHGAVTVRDAVTVTQGREEKVKERAKALSSSGADRTDEKATEDDRKLCRLLADLIAARNPKAKVKSKSRWLRDMRLLRERDDCPPADIEKAIRWLFTDKSRDATFWADVIQSPQSLREHFPQIWAKMTAPALRSVPAVESSADYLARKGLA